MPAHAPLTLSAPCKINLFLHIIGRRPDGYHLLQTLFQLLDFGDELSFLAVDASAQRVSLSCDNHLLLNDDNLILKAARLLQQHHPKVPGVHIHLRKRTPMGAGLGGGSSDAATALHGLNIFWKLGLSSSELAALGLALGADIPLFVHGHTAWAEGIGEHLTPLPHWDAPWLLVLKPPVHVSTATIFRTNELTRNTPPSTLHDFAAQRFRNDCEAVVCALYPAVAEALKWLRQSGHAFLTGTGACVVQPCVSATEAHQRLQQAPCAGFVAKARNRSRLLDEIQGLNAIQR